LSDSALRQLMYRLVSQRPGARHDPDIALFVDRPRHDSDLAFARRDDARTIRTDQARAPVLQKLPGAHHVKRWDALGNADNEFDFGVGRFHNRVRRVRWWHENHRSIRAGFFRSFLNGIKDRPALVCRSTLAGSYAADNLRAVSRARLRMESTFAPGQSLHDQSRSFINQDCHNCSLSRNCCPLRLRSAPPPQLCRPRPSWFQPPRSSAPIPSEFSCLPEHWCPPVAAPPAVEDSFSSPPLPPLQPAYPPAECRQKY